MNAILVMQNGGFSEKVNFFIKSSSFDQNLEVLARDFLSSKVHRISKVRPRLARIFNSLAGKNSLKKK